MNRFFDAVVRAVTAHGGWVNKFHGDGALCVFGAPAEEADHAAHALAAARTVADGLRPLPVDFGIGVSCGLAVAGNVGAESRFEYTVIGDPVNEAARLTELAKAVPGRVLASGTVVEAGGPEAERWAPHGSVTLRGRATPTATFVVSEGAAVVS